MANSATNGGRPTTAWIRVFENLELRIDPLPERLDLKVQRIALPAMRSHRSAGYDPGNLANPLLEFGAGALEAELVRDVDSDGIRHPSGTLHQIGGAT